MARLYDEILGIARDYMGPAAEEYIQRRCRIVLGGRPAEEIRVDRLERLAAGIDMTARGYMSPSRAARFRDEILALAKRHR